MAHQVQVLAAKPITTIQLSKLSRQREEREGASFFYTCAMAQVHLSSHKTFI